VAVAEGAAKRAGYHDVAEWGDVEQEGAYPPGTVFDTGSHKRRWADIPDLVGGGAVRAPVRPKPA
jgi:hypothetical protein